MKMNRLGKTGFNVSILGFGGIIVDQTEQSEANKYVAEAIDAGVNYFDVAPTYGNAQYILGPALKPYRKNVYLACKTEKRTKEDSQKHLYESLKALKTDYFDVYQFHSLDSEEDIKTVFSSGGAMETMQKAKQDGYIRNIGFTCHSEKAALQIMNYYDDFSTILFPVNWAYWLEKDIGSSALKAARERDMGVIAIKGLAHRNWLEKEEKPYPKCWYKPIFDDDDLADLAFRFTLSRDISLALSPGDIRMFRKALEIVNKYEDYALSDNELALLGDKAKKINNYLF